MSVGTDLLGREIDVEDFVVFHNNLYQVLGGPSYKWQKKSGMIRIVLVEKSKTTKPVSKYANHCCLVPRAEVMVWMLKGGK